MTPYKDKIEKCKHLYDHTSKDVLVTTISLAIIFMMENGITLEDFKKFSAKVRQELKEEHPNENLNFIN